MTDFAHITAGTHLPSAVPTRPSKRVPIVDGLDRLIPICPSAGAAIADDATAGDVPA
jgi:hypothetical protein